MEKLSVRLERKIVLRPVRKILNNVGEEKVKRLNSVSAAANDGASAIFARNVAAYPFAEALKLHGPRTGPQDYQPAAPRLSVNPTTTTAFNRGTYSILEPMRAIIAKGIS